MHSELANIDDPVRLLEDILILFMLVDANNTILFSKSENGLQILLNKLSIYCDKWALEANENETVNLPMCLDSVIKILC